MPFQKKYFYEFCSLDNKANIVELWQNTEAVITAEEITSGPAPFVVELPELDHKFQVVQGRGCSIQLFSDTDMKFYNSLYHVDPQEFQVRHYIDGALNFVGFLNSEMYSEPYDQDRNYIVSTNGTDGFALMDRFSFLQVSEAKYTGIKSKWEILQIILDKIALPWNDIRISLSTTFTGYSGAVNSTILHESYIDCANFYDEDDKPMSLREVLESILAPYGASIKAENGHVYITDIHTKASSSSITYKRFNASTYVYIADVGEVNEFAISDIGYLSTGHSIERSGGVNRQVVAYSPYPVKEIIPKSLSAISEFATIPTSYSQKNGYNYKTLEDNAYWNVFSPATFELSYWNNQEDANIYLRYPVLGTNQKIASLKINPSFSASGAEFIESAVSSSGIRRTFYSGVGFLITGEVLVKTKTNPYDENEPFGKEYWTIGLNYRMKVGGRYYNSGDGWIVTVTNNNFNSGLSPLSNISDKFIGFNTEGVGILLIVFNATENIVLSGDVEFEIWSDIETYDTDRTTESNPPEVDEIWIKDLKIGVVNVDRTEIEDNDVEYIGLLDKLFQNEGEKITLTCGTDTYYSDRAKILKSDGSITEWSRAGQTAKVEELLLASVSANNQTGYVTLNNMTLKNGFDTRNILTDTYIPGKKMMVKSAVINYRDNSVSCSLVEISPDTLTIVE